MIAYYYASRKGAYLEVQTMGFAVLQTIYVSGKREARMICKANNWQPWNF